VHAVALELAELTVAFGEAFDLEIEEDDIERIETVQKVVDVIHTRGSPSYRSDPVCQAASGHVKSQDWNRTLLEGTQCGFRRTA
jgi:hypothetical protein